MKNKTVIIAVTILLLLLFIAIILIPVSKKAFVKPAKESKGTIAIVIDDWGYHLDNLAIAKGIQQPLTCAVLPNLKNSTYVSGQLKKFGFEIILHLPMESKGGHGLERDTITTTMNSKQIHNILDKDLASIIFAKGISNHMGSRITEDPRVMGIVLAEAKRRKLYFLDSFVTAKSVCREVAAKTKIKFARRDVFLDNQDDPAYIREQVIKLKDLARRQKTAIGIGHDRKNTLLVLKEMLTQLEKEGYKFVFVSELAR